MLYQYSRSSFLFPWMWIFSWIKLSWYSCETNLEDSTDPSNFSMRHYVPLICKDSVTHMHCLAFIVLEGLCFTRDFTFRKLWRFLFTFLTSFTSLSALLLSPQSITLFYFVQGFWCYFIQHRWGSPNQPFW